MVRSAAAMISRTPVAAGLQPGNTITYRDVEGLPVAIMEAGKTRWRTSSMAPVKCVHPGVSRLMHRMHPVYVGGRVFGLGSTPRHDRRA